VLLKLHHAHILTANGALHHPMLTLLGVMTVKLSVWDQDPTARVPTQEAQ
jgi:hypothetical protein